MWVGAVGLRSIQTFAKSAAQVMLDLIGPKLSGDVDGEPQDWLAGFEWGEYFDEERVAGDSRSIEQEIELMLEQCKQLDAMVGKVLQTAEASFQE
jgi:hypothetical protein